MYSPNLLSDIILYNTGALCLKNISFSKLNVINYSASSPQKENLVNIYFAVVLMLYALLSISEINKLYFVLR